MRKRQLLTLMSVMILTITGNLMALERALYVRPQLKFGKIENGNGFAEVQYCKVRYDFTEKYTVEGAVSTGFTSPRASTHKFNHSVNRLGVKFTYRPFDDLGFFFEGSLTDTIAGHTNPVSYLVYDNYQAVGLNWDLKAYRF